MIRRLYRNAYKFVFGLSLNSVTSSFNRAVRRLEKIEAMLTNEVYAHNAVIDSHVEAKGTKLKQITHAGKVRARLNDLIAE